MPMFLALAAAAFMSSLVIRLTEPLVGLLARDFTVQPAEIAVFATAFALPYATFQLVFGPIGDRFGKLKVVRIAVAAVSLMLAASAFAPDYRSMLALRFATGLFAGGIIPLSLATIGDLYELPRRQVMLSRFMLASITGQVAGAFLTGLMAEFLPWRWVFGVFAALAALIAAGLFATPSGPAAATGPLTLSGVLRRYAGIVRTRSAAQFLPIVFTEGAIFFAFIAFSAPYLAERRGLTAGEIGVVIATYGLGGMLAALAIPAALRYLGVTRMIAAGAALAAGAFAVFSLALPLAGYALASAACGGSFMFIHNNLQTRATELAPATRGSALAVFACCLFLGNAFGPWLLGHVVAATSYETAFLSLAVALTVFGGVAAGVIGRSA